MMNYLPIEPVLPGMAADILTIDDFVYGHCPEIGKICLKKSDHQYICYWLKSVIV